MKLSEISEYTTKTHDKRTITLTNGVEISVELYVVYHKFGSIDEVGFDMSWVNSKDYVAAATKRSIYASDFDRIFSVVCKKLENTSFPSTMPREMEPIMQRIAHTVLSDFH